MAASCAPAPKLPTPAPPISTPRTRVAASAPHCGHAIDARRRFAGAATGGGGVRSWRTLSSCTTLADLPVAACSRCGTASSRVAT